MRRNRGFTIVEMLVVVSTCMLLALLLLPMCLQMRSSARSVVCANRLKSLGQAYGLLLAQSDGELPNAYYSFMGSKGTYSMSMLAPEIDEPDRLLSDGVSDALMCPSDDTPVAVFARNPNGHALITPSSYAYNVGLPLMYRNLSRVSEPVNTVTFYDGNPRDVVGTWVYNTNWPVKTVRARHSGHGNYLYLDGHVERDGNFPSAAFDGSTSGSHKWLASSLTVPVTFNVSGRISNLNPSNSANNDFSLELPDGFVVARSDLLSGKVINYNSYFNSNYLEYSGPATRLTVRMKRGTKNYLTIDGKLQELRTDVKYTFTSQKMTIHLCNTNYSGSNPMGDWWLDISAARATITID